MSYFLTQSPASIAGIRAAVPHEPLLIVMLGSTFGIDALDAAMKEAGLQPVVRKGAQQGGFQPKTGEAPEPQLLHHLRSYSMSDDPTVELATVMQLREGVWGEGTRPPIATFRRQVYAVLVDHARWHRRRDESAQGGPGVEGLGWSWVLVEEGDGHRSKAMVVVDVVARERQLASVEQQGPDVLRITTSPSPASTVDSACASLSWVGRGEEEVQWLARVSRTCTSLHHRHTITQFQSHPQAEGGEGEEQGLGGGVKPWPSVDQGLRVFEFFSGIGGMRLGLPSHVCGVRVAHVTAFDCSAPALQVYAHNFPEDHSTTPGSADGPARLDGLEGDLRNLLIDGLKLGDVDGQADIWTMSPPCQPYTTTRLARRLDAQDNRAKPLSHLLSLLRHMTQRPRYIVLENVKGFVGSEMLGEVKATLVSCGYTFRQLLLSPIQSAALPNHRMRFYLIAQHRDTQAGDEHWDPDLILEQFPPRIRSRYAAETPPLSAFLLPAVPPPVLERLLLPRALLDKPWAAKQISIVGQHDRGTYCFSKGYSRIVDRSTGSCLLMDAQGPLADPDFAVDRTKPLSELHGRLRRFDPDEILAISGFPPAFTWPPSLGYEKRWACIGNSVNVAVVRGVMACLFEPDAFD